MSKRQIAGDYLILKAAQEIAKKNPLYAYLAELAEKEIGPIDAEPSAEAVIVPTPVAIEPARPKQIECKGEATARPDLPKWYIDLPFRFCVTCNKRLQPNWNGKTWENPTMFSKRQSCGGACIQRGKRKQ